MRKTVELRNEALNETLNEGQAARLMGLKSHTLRKWRQLGIGPDFIRLSGRCIRYTRKDILTFLESRRVKLNGGNDGDGLLAGL
jgi:Helix-turn-helix domain